jgi:hypothetical protein
MFCFQDMGLWISGHQFLITDCVLPDHMVAIIGTTQFTSQTNCGAKPMVMPSLVTIFFSLPGRPGSCSMPARTSHSMPSGPLGSLHYNTYNLPLLQHLSTPQSPLPADLGISSWDMCPCSTHASGASMDVMCFARINSDWIHLSTKYTGTYTSSTSQS